MKDKTITTAALAAAYDKARKEGQGYAMEMLEGLFGKETFDPAVRTFSDAYGRLGIGHPLVVAYDAVAYVVRDTHLTAFLQLRVICAALNDGWEPRYARDEDRYYPRFWLSEERHKADGLAIDGYRSEYAGMAYQYAVRTPSPAHIIGDPYLCLKSAELADYCGRQFIGLWADYLLIPR